MGFVTSDRRRNAGAGTVVVRKTALAESLPSLAVNGSPAPIYRSHSRSLGKYGRPRETD
jgi:hypothetical protein